jgi:hypothetical protein
LAIHVPDGWPKVMSGLTHKKSRAGNFKKTQARWAGRRWKTEKPACKK